LTIQYIYTHTHQNCTYTHIPTSCDCSRLIRLLYFLQRLQLDLCVAVTSTKTRLGRLRQGLCSNYLASLSQGDRVVFWIRKGTFKAPSIEVPLIMIGPGTGVAPMRAFLQERKQQQQERIIPNSDGNLNSIASPPPLPSEEQISVQSPQASPPRTGSTVLFFGCRKRQSDFLYECEWRPNSAADADFYSDREGNISVITAFSRDQESKLYVTHKIRTHADLVWQALEQVRRQKMTCMANKMRLWLWFA
jgi:sulfite reductase alpha subunit-like flavoprotein